MKISKSKNQNSIEQYDKNGNFIALYDALFEIEQKFGYDRSSISKCCKGKLKSAYGYIWKYSGKEKNNEYNK